MVADPRRPCTNPPGVPARSGVRCGSRMSTGSRRSSSSRPGSGRRSPRSSSSRRSRVDVEAMADAGLTIKLLCRLADGQTVETVAMETPAHADSRRRSTVCVSSQVGCAVGCPFCATGHMGLRRNCTAAEIVDQVRAAAASLHRRGLGPVTHIVYMGMGEPLANVAATLESLSVLTRDAGISARRITVSTSGVAPGIEQLAAAKHAGHPRALAPRRHRRAARPARPDQQDLPARRGAWRPRRDTPSRAAGG